MPFQTPCKKCAKMPLDWSKDPEKKVRCSPNQHTPRSIQGAPVRILGSLCPPGSRHVGGCTAGAPQIRKTLALQPSKGPQPRPATPHLEMLQPCTDPPRPPSVRTSTQPLRMVFTRL